MRTRHFLVDTALLSLSVLTLSLSSSTAGTTIQPFTGGERTFSISTSGGNYDTPGLAWAQQPCQPASSGGFVQNGFLDPDCDPTNHSVYANQSLDFCSASSDVACVQGFWVKNSLGNWEAASSSSQIHGSVDVKSFTSHPEFHMGDAFQGLLVQFPTFNYKDANRVYFSVTRYRDFAHPNNELNNSFRINIAPMISSSTTPAFATPGQIQNHFLGGGSELGSLWEVPSSDTPTFKIELLLPNLPTGWSNGRVANIHITSKNFVANSSQKKWDVTIEGDAMAIPEVEYYYYSQNPDENARWNNLSTVLGIPWSICDCGAGPTILPSQVSMYSQAVAIDPILNTATAIKSEFTFNSGSYSSSGGQNPGGCLDSSLPAFVTSNSLLYSEVPTFNSQSSELLYDVASPHFLTDGSAFEGTYQLQLSNAAAKCLWHLSSGDFTASIQVTGSDGTQKVFTSSMTQDASNVHFQAAGFTFSSPKIAIKLVQLPLSPSANPSPQPKSTIKPTALKSTCIKGKSKKIVSGTKCPQGYKKL